MPRFGDRVFITCYWSDVESDGIDEISAWRWVEYAITVNLTYPTLFSLSPIIYFNHGIRAHGAHPLTAPRKCLWLIYIMNIHSDSWKKSDLIVMGYYFLSTRNGDCTNLVWKRKNIMTVPKPLQQGNIYSCTFMKMFMYTTENLLIQIPFRFWVRVWQEGRQNRNLSPTTLWSTHSEIILNPLMPTHVCALLSNGMVPISVTSAVSGPVMQGLNYIYKCTWVHENRSTNYI